MGCGARFDGKPVGFGARVDWKPVGCARPVGRNDGDVRVAGRVDPNPVEPVVVGTSGASNAPMPIPSPKIGFPNPGVNPVGSAEKRG